MFRKVELAVQQDLRVWLSYVFFVTWLVGVGRYWDHPSAHLWQYLGLGSVIYCCCLAGILYVVIAPLGPKRWKFTAVLVFVGLTSLPALLYAIPVEKWTSLEIAQQVNVWFLGTVAAWRVALLFRYLVAYAGLNWFLVLIGATLILSGIVFSLTLFNLEHVVFDLMAGIRPEDATSNDSAYLVVLGLAYASLFAFPIALVLYIGAVVYRLSQSRVQG